jgi:hypothetical protein
MNDECSRLQTKLTLETQRAKSLSLELEVVQSELDNLRSGYADTICKLVEAKATIKGLTGVADRLTVENRGKG